MQKQNIYLEMLMENYDFVVIGGGSAGYPAAVYAARFGLKTIVITKERGGLLATTHVVENYPGFVRLSGPELMQHMEDHVKDYDVPIVDDEVVDIEKDGDYFVVKSREGQYRAKTVVLATGTERRKLGIPGEQEFYGKGVSYCATCLPSTENVVANSSVRSIESMKEGERVLTIDGSYKFVKDTMKRPFSGELVRIKTRFFTEPVLLTPEHPVLKMNIIKGKGAKYLDFKFTEPEWVKAGELEITDVVLYPIVKETKDIESVKISDFVGVKIDASGRAANKTETHTSVRIPNFIPINHDFLRLVGYYLSEGCITNRGVNLYFNKNERAYIDDASNIVKSIFGIEPTIKIENNVARVMVFSYVLRDFFEMLFSKYAHNKKLPHWMMILPPEKQAEIVKGVWRGDGCKRSKDFMIVTNSRQLAYQLRDILLRLEILPSVETRPLEIINKKPSIIAGRKIFFKHDKYHIGIGGPHLEKMSAIVQLPHEKIASRKRSTRHALFKDGFVLLPIREISKVSYEGEVHNLAVEDNNTYVAKNFIVHNCDGPLFKGKVLGVVGGSDSAAKEALLLSEYGSKVYVIYRGDQIHPEPINMRRVEENEKIEVIPNTNVVEIKGDKFITHAVLDRPWGGSKSFELGGLFIEIGHLPQSALAKKLGVKLNQKGEIIIDRLSRTNVPGVYAAGDVADMEWKQAITGAAEGCVAAYSAYEYISAKEWD